MNFLGGPIYRLKMVQLTIFQLHDGAKKSDNTFSRKYTF